MKSAEERADAGDAVLSQLQRRTGAGGFVGSSAVENDVAVSRDLVVAEFEFLRSEAEGAGDDARIGKEVERIAEVDDGDGFAGFYLVVEFGGGNAIGGEGAEECATLAPLDDDVGSEAKREQDEEPASHAFGVSGDLFELVGEHIAEGEKGAGPDERTEGVEENETRERHAKDAGDGRSDGAESGEKLGEDQ